MKKQSSSKTKITQPVLNTDPFGKVFMIMKDGKLSPLSELPENVDVIAKPFKSEEEFAKLIFGNRSALFGENTLGWKVSVPKETQFQNTTILFDFSTPAAPRCYFLSVILGNGDGFYPDFFPYLTRLFSLIGDVVNMSRLVLFIKEQLEKDKLVLKAIQQHLQGKRLEDVLSGTLLKTPRCLLVTEDPLTELPIARKAYAETWGGILDIMYARKYALGKGYILSLHPTLAELQEKHTPVVKETKPKVMHTEADHFAKGSPLAKSIYEKLKAHALKIDRKLSFKADGAHYISMKQNGGKNLAFFHFRKSGVYIVVKLAEKFVRKTVKKAEVKSLPPSVQKFWNGESTGIVISDVTQVNEVGAVLKQLIR